MAATSPITPSYSSIDSQFLGSANRKRSFAHVDDSPDSQDHGHGDGYDGDGGLGRQQPAVKRACNECRQQKLRCDVTQSPVFTPCTRCTKQKLQCRIEANFKRVGKRSRQAEIEREMAKLKDENAQLKQQLNLPVQSPIDPMTQQTPAMASTPYMGPNIQPSMYAGLADADQFQGSHEAVASLLGLKQGLDNSTPVNIRTYNLDNVMLAPDRVEELFSEYFGHYHAFLPLLDPEKTPDTYQQDSKLLFWVIISIAARRFEADTQLIKNIGLPLSRLLWTTVSEVPQNYHVVKALCLLCTWPLPTSRTSTDPTFMLCGLMMRIAMQIGLHRPAHAKDFSRLPVHLREDDIKDRLKTWTVCNIVTQTVSTGYGQPSTAVYEPQGSQDTPRIFDGPPELIVRYEIEKRADQVTKTLYSSSELEEQQTVMAELESGALKQLKVQYDKDFSSMDELHASAVHLHIRLQAFFNDSEEDYRPDLVKLYYTTKDFLDAAFSVLENGNRLIYTTNYLMQMLLAAGFALMRLLCSSHGSRLPVTDGVEYTNKAIRAIRAMRIFPNDLPDRLAEVLQQLWDDNGNGPPKDQKFDPGFGGLEQIPAEAGEPLRLEVRGRMSMSVVFDSVWRWRAKWQGKGGKRDLDSTLDASGNNQQSTTAQQQQLQTGSSSGNTSDSMAGYGGTPSRILTEAPDANSLSAPSSNFGVPYSLNNNGAMGGLGGFADSYESFDSLGWALDFPFWQLPGNGFSGDINT